jgi:hypothetical protein
MYQSRDYKTLDGQSALYNDIITEIDANGPYYIKTGTNPIKLQDGTMANPALTFESDTKNDTGIYKLTAPNGLGISSSGYERLKVHDSFTESFSQIRQIDGSATLPCITFSSDTDTGIYREGTNAIGFTTNGVQKLHIHAAHLEAFQPLRLPNGSVSTPALNFSNDQDCGLYRAGTNDIRIAANGQDVSGFDANNFVLYKPLISSVQPYSVYYRNTNQTSISGTTTLLYDTKEQEYSNQITFSNGVYTVTNAGTYLVQADIQISNASSMDVSSFFTINNSATNRSGYVVTRASTVHLVSLCNIIYLAASDTIRTQVICATNSTFEVSSNGTRRPRFSILRIF